MRSGRHGAAPRRRIVLVLAILAIALLALGTLVANRLARPEREARTPSPPSVTGAGPSATPSAQASAPPPTPHPIPGYLLIADRGNNRLLLVDSRKRILWRYPKPGRAPTFPFTGDDDAFFSPSYRSIISQQEFQQTIQVLSFPAGRVLWHYGHPDVAGAGSGYLNTPDDAYLLAGGIRQVADIRNCRVLFISPGHRIVRRLGTTGVCRHDPPRFLDSPNGDTPMPNGGTLVSEIGGSWVDAVSRSGRLDWSVHAPVAYPSDAQWLGHGRILLTDFSDPGKVLIIDRRGRVLWRYGPASGPGMLNHPSLALMIAPGLIAVNDDFRARVVLISVARHRIVWQYGHTDRPGSGAGYLSIPDGMAFLPWADAMGIPAVRALIARR